MTFRPNSNSAANELDIAQLVDHYIAAHCITYAQYQFLSAAVLADGTVRDLPDAVTLPDPVIVTEPVPETLQVVDGGTLDVSWEPSKLALPLELELRARGDQGGRTVFCRVEDDGVVDDRRAVSLNHAPPELRQR